jgi:hypothetical protein
MGWGGREKEGKEKHRVRERGGDGRTRRRETNVEDEEVWVALERSDLRVFFECYVAFGEMGKAGGSARA